MCPKGEGGARHLGTPSAYINPLHRFLSGFSAIENELGLISEYELQSLMNCNNSGCYIFSIKGN